MPLPENVAVVGGNAYRVRWVSLFSLHYICYSPPPCIIKLSGDRK